MKIRIWSDLHLEGAGLTFSQSCPDEVLVLAGDIHNSPILAAEFCNKMAKLFKAIVYVPGNHEGYKGIPAEEYSHMFNARLEVENVYFLNTRSVLIDDVTFIGATLWTSFDNGSPRVIKESISYINDFNLIMYKGHRMKPDDMIREHKYDLHFIRESCKHIEGKKVIVSHFPPIRAFQHPRWGNLHTSPLNGYFMSDLDCEIKDLDFNLWIAGHTHDGTKFTKYGKDFICNPRGYAYRGKPENGAWDINLVYSV